MKCLNNYRPPIRDPPAIIEDSRTNWPALNLATISENLSRAAADPGARLYPLINTSAHPAYRSFEFPPTNAASSFNQNANEGISPINPISTRQSAILNSTAHLTTIPISSSRTSLNTVLPSFNSSLTSTTLTSAANQSTLPAATISAASNGAAITSIPCSPGIPASSSSVPPANTVAVIQQRPNPMINQREIQQTRESSYQQDLQANTVVLRNRQAIIICTERRTRDGPNDVYGQFYPKELYEVLQSGRPGEVYAKSLCTNLMKWIRTGPGSLTKLVQPSDGFLYIATQACKRTGCLTFSPGEYLVVQTVNCETYFTGYDPFAIYPSHRWIPKTSVVPVLGSIYEYQKIAPNVSIERIVRLDANSYRIAQTIELERNTDSS